MSEPKEPIKESNRARVKRLALEREIMEKRIDDEAEREAGAVRGHKSMVPGKKSKNHDHSPDEPSDG